MATPNIAQALTIAGSDSGGGAGIQADLKTMHAHGVFGTSVITAVTAQNTLAVFETFDLPVSIVEAQLNAVLEDFEIAAVKTGMLSSSAIVRTTADALAAHAINRIIVDPVMISTSGDKLLTGEAIDTLKNTLLAHALLVTPNLHEAELLAEMSIESEKDMKIAAKRIRSYGCENVLVKGGHAEFKKATDLLFDGKNYHEFPGEFVATDNLHGTGCTFSAAITARLALGEPLLEAIAKAKIYISHAISNALDIGRGHGPTDHFYFLDRNDFDPPT